MKKIIAFSETSPIANKERKEVLVPRSFSHPECWVNDFFDEIFHPGYPVYERYYKGRVVSNLASYHQAAHRYKLVVNLKKGRIIVQVRIATGHRLSPSEMDDPKVRNQAIATLASLTRMLHAAVAECWNNQFVLTIRDPVCGRRDFPIEYQVVEVISSGVYHEGSPPTSGGRKHQYAAPFIPDFNWLPQSIEQQEHFHLIITRDHLQTEGHRYGWFHNQRIMVTDKTDKYSLARVFGECLGLPMESMPGLAVSSDARPDTDPPDVLRFKKIDGTWDKNEVLMLGRPPATWQNKMLRRASGVDNVMTAPNGPVFVGTSNSRVLFPRHGWWVGIEVQRLLRERLKRNVTCDIRMKAQPAPLRP